MRKKNLPRPFFPWDISDFLEDEGYFFNSTGGLNVYEEKNSVIVEAALPGISRDDQIEITFDQGVLWIRAERREEDEKDKKYYQRARHKFSYHISVPGNIDPNKEPTASFSDGLIKVEFSKLEQTTPKKISIKRM